jgi:hypothetical protein
LLLNIPVYKASRKFLHDDRTGRSAHHCINFWIQKMNI